ncbi:UDP-N-acetylmuramoyl-L-alanine--D-glutamate ligase [bacterium]|nr:UDP-N-acetylmuramoyl-L-alanine--D-glutamate ligase [bacterium]
MKIKELENKKILILGLGREGIDTLLFLRKIFPQKIIGVGDKLSKEKLKKTAREVIEQDKNIILHLGDRYLEAIKDYEVIIKSPGISFYLPELKKARKQKKIVTSQTELFFDNSQGKIIGVTGTKGKSTTTSLIYKILKKAKKRVYLLGNIGKPALSFLFLDKQENLYVYELSSHQLIGIKKSPHISILLNIYPEHLDYYPSFNEYIKAKANITRYQSKNDYLIFNGRNRIVKEIAEKSKAKRIDINKIDIKKIISPKEIPLKGNFNLQNIKAAVAVAKILEISPLIIKNGIKEFQPLPHRLEFVGRYKGIIFINDALSTIPEATIAAIDTLGNDIETIILGGFDRGIDFSKLAKKILKTNIKTLILFPTTGKKIWELIKKEATEKDLKRLQAFPVNNMKKAVEIAYKYTKKGKICLLSCASPSFSLFKDYKEKGNLFKKYVKQLGL